MGLCVFSKKIDIGSPIEKVFKSFIDTDFLPALFPASIGLKLQKRTSRYLGTGCSFSFEARFWGVRLKWVSYVNSFSLNRHFSYVWQKSPLKCWEHDFYFESLPGGSRVTECIIYRFPLGGLGKWFDRLYFQNYLRQIYRQRDEKLYEEFPALASNKTEQTQADNRPIAVGPPLSVRQGS